MGFTSQGNIPRPELSILPRNTVVVDSPPSGHLDDIRNRGVVRNFDRLPAREHDVIVIARRKSTPHTFGFPVVPLEKLKNATFVFPSPGLSRLSTKFG